MSPEEDRLADAVNQEPIVFNDCTQKELAMSFGGGLVLGVIIGLFLGASIGMIMFGLVLGLILGLGLSWASMFYLKYIRQKYYETWLGERVYLIKRSLGFGSHKPFIDLTQRYGKGVKRRE